MKTNLKIHAAILSMAFASAFTLNAQTLYLYEGFDYTAGNLVGNNGGTWDAATSWSTTGNGGTLAAATVLSTSLTFSGISTVGGSAEITSNVNSGDSSYPSWTARRALPTGISIASGSDVWVSFLFNQQQSGSFANQTWLSFGDNKARQQTITRFGDDDPDNFRTGASGGEGAVGPAIIAQNTTYFAISRLTNVNAPNFAAQSNTATMWVFDEASWAFVLSNGITEANLDTHALGIATHSVGPTDFPLQIGSSDSIDLTVITDFGTNNRAIFDELRVGSALSVVAIPEPSTVGLLGLGVLSLALLRRRGRK